MSDTVGHYILKCRRLLLPDEALVLHFKPDVPAGVAWIAEVGISIQPPNDPKGYRVETQDDRLYHEGPSPGQALAKLSGSLIARKSISERNKP